MRDLNRRSTIRGIAGAVSASVIAGCSRISGVSENVIENVSFDGNTTIVEISDSDQVSQINLLDPEGESVRETAVSAGEERATFRWHDYDQTEIDPLTPGDYRIVVVSENSTQVGEQTIEYEPDVTVREPVMNWDSDRDIDNLYPGGLYLPLVTSSDPPVFIRGVRSSVKNTDRFEEAEIPDLSTYDNEYYTTELATLNSGEQLIWQIPLVSATPECTTASYEGSLTINLSSTDGPTIGYGFELTETGEPAVTVENQSGDEEYYCDITIDGFVREGGGDV